MMLIQPEDVSRVGLEDFLACQALVAACLHRQVGQFGQAHHLDGVHHLGKGIFVALLLGLVEHFLAQRLFQLRVLG